MRVIAFSGVLLFCVLFSNGLVCQKIHPDNLITDSNSRSLNGIEAKADPTILSPDSLCGIYGNDLKIDTIRHRLIPLNTGGWFTGYGVDSTVNNMNARIYYIDGTKFNPTITKPDTAIITYTLSGSPGADTTIKIPVFAAWDNTFQGVLGNGVPYATVNFCASNPEMDTLSVAGPNPVWEYLDRPSAMIDKSLGVLDAKMASFGKDFIGRVKVGYYGFCGTDTTVSVQFVKAPEVEIIPKIYCESYVQDLNNFSKIDTVWLRIPKGPALGGTGIKTLDSNGFNANTEVKVYYGSIAQTGWPTAIDQTTVQYLYNYWNGNTWMTLPQNARFRVFSLPKGKNKLIYTFGIRYRQFHSNFACQSTDSTFIERVDSMHLTLKDTHRICGSNTVELDAGGYSEAAYKWNTGAAKSKILVSKGGIYTVTVTTAYCKSTKSTHVINGCVGVEENLETGVQIKLFPNPTSSIINLELVNVKSDMTQLKIIDLLGNEVSSSVFDNSSSDNSMQIDVSPLAKGVYLFEIKSGESYSTYRVVVE